MSKEICDKNLKLFLIRKVNVNVHVKPGGSQGPDGDRTPLSWKTQLRTSLRRLNGVW